MKTTLLLVALLAPSAQAACPKNKKEWQKLGPKIFLEQASRQKAPVELPDFSAKLGKSASGSATLFKERKTEFVLMKAEDKDSSLFLSGVMRCDAATKEPVLLSLTWVKGEKSGLVKLLR